MTQDLLEHRDGGVLTLTMNRPERRNAMTPVMLEALLQALRGAVLDPVVRAVVLTGAGGAFCAGGDVKAMAERNAAEQTMEQRTVHLREAMEISRLLHEMPKPTVALARGATAGAGLSLALACDLFLAADTAKITSAFVKVALSGDFGGHWFLAQRLGARARAFALLSPVIDGNEALRIGLVDQVFPDAELETKGMALARQLAGGPTTTLAHMKENMNQAERGCTLAEALDQEAFWQIRCGYTDDHREAAKAFVEKRTPRFIGR
ncbi:MAG: enoyl-CoA hydratase [Burkholderiaceae bacterium]|nr:MAG: enoyl-CoA hydratase [Burkholderiaceae bacterium]